MAEPVTTLFLDIGGVLLTNGWDRHLRRRTADRFGIDYEELNERHHLTFDTYEAGKLSLAEYLARAVFSREGPLLRKLFATSCSPSRAPSGDDRTGPGSQRALSPQTGGGQQRGAGTDSHRIAGSASRNSSIFSSAPASSTSASRTPISSAWPSMSPRRPQKTGLHRRSGMFVDVAPTLGIRGIHHTTTGRAARAGGFRPSRGDFPGGTRLKDKQAEIGMIGLGVMGATCC